MLIVDDLLFGLPVKGVRWVLEQLVVAVDREMTDEEPILQAILENEMALEEGRIGADAYGERQAALMARLREVKERKRGAAEEKAAGGPISGKASLEVELDFGGYGGKAKS